MLDADIAEQKKLLTQLRTDIDEEQKQSDKRRRILERAETVSTRVHRKCDEFTVAVDAIESENGRLIDLVNQ